MRAEQQGDDYFSLDALNIEPLYVAASGVVSGAAEQAAYREEVLLGQNLGRGHERGLFAVPSDSEHRGSGHDGLAAAHIALEKAAHRPVGAQV